MPAGDVPSRSRALPDCGSTTEAPAVTRSCHSIMAGVPRTAILTRRLFTVRLVIQEVTGLNPEMCRAVPMARPLAEHLPAATRSRRVRLPRQRPIHQALSETQRAAANA